MLEDEHPMTGEHVIVLEDNRFQRLSLVDGFSICGIRGMDPMIPF